MLRCFTIFLSTFAIIFFGVFFFVSQSVFAATITVDSLADTEIDSDGDCTLREAINNAGVYNTDTTAGDCTAGTGGADTISFSVTGVIAITSAFPTIQSSDTTIAGPGSGLLEIDASGSSANEIFILSSVNGSTLTGMTMSDVKERAVLLNASDDNTFDDLIITGRGGVSAATLVELTLGSDNNTITNCDVSLSGLGIRMISNSNNNTVDSCSSHDNYHSGLTIYDSSYNTLSNNTIENINGVGYGMFIIEGADNNTIENNIVTGNIDHGVSIGGTGADLGPTTTNTFTGNTITNNGNYGITLGLAEDIIFEDNTISGNTDGGVISTQTTSGLQFLGNTIIDNLGGEGILILNATDLTIGGAVVGDRNVISGNGDHGIEVETVTGSILGNYIGIAANGTTLKANTGSGINVTDTSTITIGGDTSLERNVIAGNTGNGIKMDSVTTGSILGNYIGVDSSGTTVVANGNNGINVINSSSITIGGSLSGERNIIAGNTDGGIFLDTVITSLITGNYIGVTADGMTDAGNGSYGINIADSTSITIGGDTSGERNIIAGNVSDGINLDSVTTGSILGNYIGIASDGTTIVANDFNGINITDSDNITIGGDIAGERNVISGNGQDGVVFNTTTNSSVTGNYIGVTADGDVVAGNTSKGINVIDSDDITIGGDAEGEGNVISGSGDRGVGIYSGSNNYTIQGNYIGLDATGINLLSNGPDQAIELENAGAGIVGGATALARNYIAGDTEEGIKLADPTPAAEVLFIGNYFGINTEGDRVGEFLGSSLKLSDSDLSGVIVGGDAIGEGNVISGSPDGFGIDLNGSGARIFGNKIGTNADGIVSAGFGNDIGVLVLASTASNNQIGGINPGEGNIIAGNSSIGIGLAGYPDFGYPTNNSILGNSILGHTFGIDLIEDLTDPVLGHTANDSGDSDAGPNDFLNHPIITGVNPSTDVVTYSLDVPTGYYRVEFFKNPTNGLSDSGYGEGEEFVGYDIAQSVGSALAGETTTIGDGIESSDVVTATATKCTSSSCTAFLATSEFSDSETPSTPSLGGSSSRGGRVRYGCKDLLAVNYKKFVSHRQSLCVYSYTLQLISSVTPVISVNPAQTVSVLARTLSFGMSSEDIKELQVRLNNIGFTVTYSGMGSPGYENTHFGPNTLKAVQKFQTANNLTTDGIVNQQIWDKIVTLDTPVLRRLDTGPEMNALQKFLNKDPETQVAPYGVGSRGQETQLFGPATEAALIKWQKKNGFTPTGIVNRRIKELVMVL